MGQQGTSAQAVNASADKSQQSGDAIAMPIQQDREARPEQKGSVKASDKLNADSGQYRKGPSV